MIDIVPFKFKYLPQLKEILESRGKIDMFNAEMKTLPKIGYLALLNNQPIAVGFLRRLEPCFAQIDTLASNSYFGSKIRHDAIQLIVNSLIEDANRLELKGILALTTDSGVITRARELGFNEINQTVIVKTLT